MAQPHLSRASKAELLLPLATGMGLESHGPSRPIRTGVLCRRDCRQGLTRADLPTWQILDRNT